MKAGLRALLRASAPLVALTPGGIDWGFQAQDEPIGNIVLTQVSASPTYGTQGRLTHTDYRVQLDCYSSTAAGAQAIAAAVLDVLDGYRTEPFLGVLLVTSRDLRGGDENSVIHRVSMDFLIVHRG